MAMPEYTDGVLELYEITNDESEDYPEERLKYTGLRIWYRELAVYDTTRAKLSADSVEVTYKLAIPQYKKINSKCICLIDGEQHEIYNIAHTTTKDGFKESELTLKTPAYEREVIDDTELITGRFCGKTQWHPEMIMRTRLHGRLVFTLESHAIRN